MIHADSLKMLRIFRKGRLVRTGGIGIQDLLHLTCRSDRCQCAVGSVHQLLCGREIAVGKHQHNQSLSNGHAAIRNAASGIYQCKQNGRVNHGFRYQEGRKVDFHKTVDVVV